MSKKTDGWMPLYVADYLADTARLSTEQHGAYMLIIMDYWRNGAPPDDASVLASITRLPAAGWKKHAPALRLFFSIEGGKWVHKRIESERSKASGISDKRTDAARKGAAKRWGKRMQNAMPNGMPNAEQSAWQNDAPSPYTNNQIPLQPHTPLVHDAPVCVENSISDHPSFDELPESPRQAPPLALTMPSAPPAPTPTEAGLACLAMKKEGVTDVNPSSPKLVALLEAGATTGELAAAARVAVAQKAGFAYALGVVQRQREQAAAMAPGLHTGPLPKSAAGKNLRQQVISGAAAAIFDGATHV